MYKVYKIIYLILILFAFGCAYEPILTNKSYQFSINFSEQEGNKKINKFIVERLNYIQNENYTKKFLISLESTLNKKVISKDSKGDPSIFETNLITVINIKDNMEKEYIRTINKKNTYNNKSDKFELEQYEDILIKNASENIAEEILAYLSNL
tara:strand:- start:837 stop:1295 length:459 start_codon:yes stop_codon:yes gene_type:complete